MLCNKCLFIIIKLSIIGFIFVAIVHNNPYATLLKQPPLSIGQVIGVVFMFFYIIEPKMEGLFGMVGMLLRYDNTCFNDYADNVQVPLIL